MISKKGYPKRYLKNYIINQDFQFKFLLRFFIFSFIVFSIGGFIQLYIAKQIIYNKFEDINKNVEDRKSEVIARLLDYEKDSPEKVQKHSDESKNSFETEKKYLLSEINFIRVHVNYIKSIFSKDLKILGKSFWISLIGIGVFLNLFFAFSYGILLTHRLAGNHYRLVKFAKQLQEKDFKTPLVVRTRDFFQNTSNELDKVRVSVYKDIKQLSELPELKDNEIIKKYKL